MGTLMSLSGYGQDTIIKRDSQPRGEGLLQSGHEVSPESSCETTKEC